MRIQTHLCRFVLTCSVAMGLLTVTSSPAHAISGLYLQLGGGVADFSGNELIIAEVTDGQEDRDPDTCCPPLSIGTQFRLGYSIFGFGGPEFTFVGTGWDSFSGGAGFIGGGIRLYPLKFFSLVGFDTESFPLDLTAGANFGYAIAGQDFAYTGTFWDFDVGLDYKIASFLSIGARLDIILPNYDAFVYTSFANDRGVCYDTVAFGESQPKEDLQCEGDGPSTTILSPQLVFTFHFSLFGI